MSANFFELQRYAATGIASAGMTYHDRLKAMMMFPQSYPSTTVTGIPPLSFKANGKPLASWSISGQTVQDGIPTPDAPIYPEFVGERTANLFDYETMKGGKTGYYLDASGNEIPNTGYWSITKYIPVEGTAFTLTRTFGGNAPSICLYDSNKNFITGMSYQGERVVTISSNTNVAYIRFSYFISAPLEDIAHDMLNSGSTAKPYEPYGYKLPIACGGQTVPIYLGQVQTVRRIKKLVLDGTEENDEFVYAGLGYVRLSDGLGEIIAPYSDKLLGTVVPTADIPAFSIKQSGSDITPAILAIKAGEKFQNTTAFKSWLAENQITVWYVLANEQTGIVNEPLCKIGNYADTVASTNTGAPSIPTRKGANTLTVGTTLQPSSVTITT